jgi:CHAT domain-containing protein
MGTRNRWLYRLLSFVLAGLVAIALPGAVAADTLETMLQRSRQHYEAGNLEAAQQALETAEAQAQQGLSQAVIKSNLALLLSQQGAWERANAKMRESLQALGQVSGQQGAGGVGTTGSAGPPAEASPQDIRIWAQVLTIQGRLYLGQGNAAAALSTWQTTTRLDLQIQNTPGVALGKLRQAEALQAMGKYAQAYGEILEPLYQQVQNQPNSLVKAQVLRRLGETSAIVGKRLGVAGGDRQSAEGLIQQSLEAAIALQNPEEIAASQLAKANVLSTKVRTDYRFLTELEKQEDPQYQANLAQALQLYGTVAEGSSSNRLRAGLNQLRLLASLEQPGAAPLARQLYPEITARPSHPAGIQAQLNFAHSVLMLQPFPMALPEVEALLQKAIAQAQQLGDARLVAEGLGNLGRAQLRRQQIQLAKSTTGKALAMANSIQATDQVYRWSVQLGQIQEALQDLDGAVVSYRQAVGTLRQVRRDLVGINPEQLVNPEDLEPVQQRLVNLLLADARRSPSAEVLAEVRGIIESLRVEEINNYLRSECFQAQTLDKIEVPQTTAIIYPIVLPHRVAILVSGKNQAPQLFSLPQPIEQAAFTATVKRLEDSLQSRIDDQHRAPATELYQLLIKPIEAQLQRDKVETLVFVLDGELQKIPMAVLYDGSQYLIEKYSVATTPGLTLTNPRALQQRALSGVAFGLTQPSQVMLSTGTKAFVPLPAVEDEIKQFAAQIPALVKQDAQFTRDAFTKTLQKSRSPIVHLATHGQFSSNLEQTFLVTGDNQTLNTEDLAIALSASRGTGGEAAPIELLVLSACETASGDSRAPLGLAGIALQSGAQSTVASLWKVDDTSTAELMQQFYRQIASRKVSKAVALQIAQREVLKQYPNPRNWAPFILVGNWL